MVKPLTGGITTWIVRCGWGLSNPYMIYKCSRIEFSKDQPLSLCILAGNAMM